MRISEMNVAQVAPVKYIELKHKKHRFTLLIGNSWEYDARDKYLIKQIERLRPDLNIYSIPPR